MLQTSTSEKKKAWLSKSDGPWRCLNWLVLQQEPEFVDADCCTALVSPIAFWMVKGQWKETCLGKESSRVYLAANSIGCQVHNRHHIFCDILKKNFANKWSKTAAGKSKTSTMLPMFIDDKYRCNVFISLPVFLSFRFLPDQLTCS